MKGPVLRQGDPLAQHRPLDLARPLRSYDPSKALPSVSSSALNYLVNLFKLLRGNRLLRPLVVTYYLSAHCNLNCAYCEDFGAEKNALADAPLPLDAARSLLRTVRSGTDALILTGGEPLLYPDIEALVAHARRDLGFRHLTLQTNGSLLAEHEEVLSHIDRLVVSLDSTDPALISHISRVPLAAAEAILDNVRTYARRQREFSLQMVANCVLSPETLPEAQNLVDFCAEAGLLVSFSPQAANNWPRYELLTSDEYRAFLQSLVAQKWRGAPILASEAYLQTVLDLQPYSCYPVLVPRVMPNGDLVYPCWPIEKGGYSHGGRPCNLLEVESWPRVQRLAADVYGEPPRVCTSCFQQCYAEPSLMQAQPLSHLGEWLRYRASRRGRLASYAPG